MSCSLLRDPVLFVSVDTSRPSQPGHPTVYSADPGLGQTCVPGRPRCLLGARLSSCSSTGACDFAVGSTVSATSMGTSPPRRAAFYPRGFWLFSPSSRDTALLSTIGLGKFGTGFEDALTPSPLPPCSGAPERARTTITSFLLTGVPRHGGCVASCHVCWLSCNGCAPHSNHQTCFLAFRRG